MESNTNFYGKWFDTLTGKTILEKKYFYEKETTDDFFNRVSGIFSESIKPKMKEALINADFFVGGRSLYGAGSKGKFKSSMSNCFTAGNKVITKRGLINIEDVVTGDMVITDNGSWQKVDNVMSRTYVGDLFEISADTIYDKITCTPNHKFLTNKGWLRADRLLTTSDNVRRCHKLKVPTCRFNKEYKIIDITEYYPNSLDTELYYEGSKVGYKTLVGEDRIPVRQGNLINRDIEIDSEFSYFIGRWLGDGSVTARKGKKVPSILQIVFNATTEIEASERCIKIGEDKFGIKASVCVTKQNTIAVRFENPIISSWFQGEFGKGCSGKFVKEKYLGDFNIALGLLDSDGMIYTHGAVSITLKNLNLINWLRDTLYLNGVNCQSLLPTIHDDTYKLHIPTGIAKSKLVPFMSKTYYDGRNSKTTYKDLNCNFVNVKEINIIENVTTTVYNLSVENNHSYTINGIICHNCYILPMPEDNLESINEVAGKMARIFSYGG